jgi:hypothetical protein
MFIARRFCVRAKTRTQDFPNTNQDANLTTATSGPSSHTVGDLRAFHCNGKCCEYVRTCADVTQCPEEALSSSRFARG